MPGAAPSVTGSSEWLIYQRISTARQRLNLSLELQDQKHGGNLVDRQSGICREFVDANRIMTNML
jgi:hypothetical protein